MDPRYNWAPQAHGAYPNGQYVPSSQPNGFAPNGYSMPYGTQPPPMQPHFPSSQPGQPHPRVVIPPRPTQQSPPQTAPQQRYMHPQVQIPQRTPNPMPHVQNPHMRQSQAPSYSGQRPVQRASNGVAVEQRGHQQPVQTPVKSAQHSRSFQENTPRPQQRHVDTPGQNQNQHRAPLQPQGTPAHVRTPTTQSRSPSIAQISSQARAHPQVVIKNKPSTQLQTPTRPQHAPVRPLPADLMVLILSAADEYIAAARSLGSTAAMTLRPADLDQYYKLMATAMGCMETVLKKYNQTPRDEAILRLRYASLLVEETDNTQDIEETLAKGITLCNRSKLTDLKYAMLHLQARYQFKSNHRAALKLLDQPIAEAETFKHIVWVYAFRFLKVSLALQVPGRPETSSALQQLHAIASHAERGDKAIYVTCCALEAMIHLRSSAADRLEQAQRAIASARSLQLELSAKQMGSINILIDYIDVACSIQQGQPSQEKLTALQSKVDQNVKPDNGAFAVLIEKSSAPNLTFSTGGVFRKADDGRDELVFAWLPQNDFGMLAYYLSGLVVVTKEKGTKYLQEGHLLTQAAIQRSSSYPISVPKSLGQRNWVKILDWHIKYALGIAACYHEDKATAQLAVSMLRERSLWLPFKGLESYARALSYLSGMVDQANGSTESALATYSGSEFDLPGAESGTSFSTDISLLAAMNRMLIIRDPSHPQHYLSQILFAQLQPLCQGHPNQYIDCAFRIIHATTQEESIKGHKTLIHTTTNRAQRLGNAQFVSMCLNYMASKFFANQVGEQPIKCARAARNVSSQGPVLWRAVAWGVCIDTFQRNGLLDDAQNCQIAFEAIRDKLPPTLRGEAPDADGDIDFVE